MSHKHLHPFIYILRFKPLFSHSAGLQMEKNAKRPNISGESGGFLTDIYRYLKNNEAKICPCIILIPLLSFLDINECERNNGGCQHRCINVEGSFTCDCNPGWQLGNDGRTCYSKLTPNEYFMNI